MKIVRVATDPPYDVRIGRGLLAEVAAETGRYSRRAVLTDDVVAPLYLARLGIPAVPALAVRAGEAAKSFPVLERVLEFMAESDLDRGSCLIALGGGVVGDLGGLAASLYMRGISVAQVPTTLLAQVDASVGGKTAVDLAAGKNLAGSFHQPAAVFADTGTLATLSDAEFRSGLGEVVKSALIEGEEALVALERAVATIRARDPDGLAEIVARCVALKAAIVSRDPMEKGERKQLNLGHTFSHAIEQSAGYGAVPHGLAVAVGLVLALRTSRQVGLLSEAALPRRIQDLLRSLGLPHDLDSLRATHPGVPDAARITAAMRHDKKGAAGQPRFVLPAAAGKLEVDVPVDEARIPGLLASSAI
jgi:3-dehydroquinate synthase